MIERIDELFDADDAVMQGLNTVIGSNHIEDSTGLDAALDIERLCDTLRQYTPITVLTGAGCSTASGIPDYRDFAGRWKQKPPMQYGEFMSHESARCRYWSRSMIGWVRFSSARPNPLHFALATLEQHDLIHSLITQNVDSLHSQAGQQQVIDLHGRLADVVCTTCGDLSPREMMQQRLYECNPDFARHIQSGATDILRTTADGDVLLDDLAGLDDFSIPPCSRCGGVLKPDVVFFGEAVPRERVSEAYAALESSAMLLVVGSSLMVYSGYRFCRAAVRSNIPVVIVNAGRTRADDVAEFKIEADLFRVFDAVIDRLDVA
ncbi:MAG: NAD-dependent protein deacetylase [marine bacterium B5-7]|nr:MAG: NAD-dependent protein deacetylase [marine bacterium B5-7]